MTTLKIPKLAEGGIVGPSGPIVGSPSSPDCMIPQIAKVAH